MDSKRKSYKNRKHKQGHKSSLQKSPSISLCMIVKNEEKFLPGCLRSVKDFVDEIIIVDTGSTDRTIDIARDFGAKVYDHPWENDFAKHRNQSIAYARGDWILILDADEELVYPGGQTIKKAVKNDAFDSIAVSVINPINKGKDFATFNSVRVFKNNGQIRYEGIVHNREVGCRKTSFYPVQIIHHGYNLDENKAKAKFERTATLLKKKINEEPDNPLHHHYLSASYMSLGSCDPAYYLKAIEESTLAIELAAERDSQNPLYLGSHYVAAASHFNLGNMKKAASVCEDALERFPDHLDSLFLLARIGDRLGTHLQASEYAERYLKVREKILRHPERSGRMMNINISCTLPINMIRAKAAYELGAKDLSKRIFMPLCRKHSGDWRMFASAGRFYYERSDYQAATYYLKRATDLHKDKLLLYMLCECHGKAKRTKDQIEALGTVITLFPEEKENLKQIGIAQFRKSNFGVADFCLRKVSEMGGTTPEVNELLSKIAPESKMSPLFKKAGTDRTPIGKSP